jgi:hypothetical protein
MKKKKDIFNKDRRNLLKVSKFSIILISFLKLYPINFFKEVKSYSLKFVKKNKKVWIMSQNDFK